MNPRNSLSDLLKNLNPLLDQNTYVFVLVHEYTSDLLEESIGMFREKEGITLILKKETAQNFKLESTDEWSMITLQVNSQLHDVGLTAAVSDQLGKHSIPCNVIAAYHHDHIFVPKSLAETALKALRGLT